jgi:chromate reductase
MPRSLNFLGIAGSLRRESYNRALLRAAGALTPPDVTLETFDIASLPLFNQDEEQTPPMALAVSSARSATPTRSCSPRRSTTTRSRGC